MIQLERYKGTKSRHTCPACNQKNQFTRFVDDAGNYIADNVGICNRSSKCGYRYTAKQYYADNPQNKKADFKKSKKRSNSNYGFADKEPSQNLAKVSKADYIAPEHLTATIGNYDRNAFVQFLFDLFPDCSEEIQSVLKMYFVGTYENSTCFPYLDRLNRVCRGKLIRFNPATGNRLKGDFDTSSLVRKLKLKEDFQYKQTFFGENLLPKFPDKPVAIVEAEKTAILASLCLPEFVWLATGSKQWLKTERLQRLDGRQTILYPDSDGFSVWRKIAIEAAVQGMPVKVSSLIENNATDEQRANGYDLADYLINEQSERNKINKNHDAYNAKLEMVLNDESLFAGFNLFLEEQKAIAMYNGSTESEAERICTRPENIRRVVLSL